jgi:Ubiquitin family
MTSAVNSSVSVSAASSSSSGSQSTRESKLSAIRWSGNKDCYTTAVNVDECDKRRRGLGCWEFELTTDISPSPKLGSRFYRFHLTPSQIVSVRLDYDLNTTTETTIWHWFALSDRPLTMLVSTQFVGDEIDRHEVLQLSKPSRYPEFVRCSTPNWYTCTPSGRVRLTLRELRPSTFVGSTRDSIRLSASHLWRAVTQPRYVDRWIRTADGLVIGLHRLVLDRSSFFNALDRWPTSSSNTMSTIQTTSSPATTSTVAPVTILSSISSSSASKTSSSASTPAVPLDSALDREMESSSIIPESIEALPLLLALKAFYCGPDDVWTPQGRTPPSTIRHFRIWAQVYRVLHKYLVEDLVDAAAALLASIATPALYPILDELDMETSHPLLKAKLLELSSVHAAAVYAARRAAPSSSISIHAGSKRKRADAKAKPTTLISPPINASSSSSSSSLSTSLDSKTVSIVDSATVTSESKRSDWTTVDWATVEPADYDRWIQSFLDDDGLLPSTASSTTSVATNTTTTPSMTTAAVSTKDSQSGTSKDPIDADPPIHSSSDDDVDSDDGGGDDDEHDADKSSSSNKRARSDSTFTVLVKTITGKTVTLSNIYSNDTVLDLQHSIQLQEGTPVDQQRLIYQNKKLCHPELTLSSYGIGSGSVLHMIGGLRGS